MEDGEKGFASFIELLAKLGVAETLGLGSRSS